jgi:LacI family transcriptional regulator
VKDGWLVRHQGKGTFVADSVGKKVRPHTSHLAMVLPSQEDYAAAGHAPVIFNFLRGCGDGAAACGANLAMVTLPNRLSESQTKAAVESVRRYDGALFGGMQYESVIRELRQQQFPFVIWDDERDSGTNVTYDRVEAVRLGVEHLVQHGYRQIGFLGNREEDCPQIKYGFFVAALREFGLTVNESGVVHCLHLADAHAGAARFLDRSPLPQAVLVDDYHKAQALVQLAEQRGLRVPDDLAVMGYGTDTGMCPTLSFVQVPSQEMGSASAALLDQVIRGAVFPPVTRVLRARLVIRQSCGCKPAPSEESSPSSAE